jgi:hypothetical protein
VHLTPFYWRNKLCRHRAVFGVRARGQNSPEWEAEARSGQLCADEESQSASAGLLGSLHQSTERRYPELVALSSQCARHSLGIFFCPKTFRGARGRPLVLPWPFLQAEIGKNTTDVPLVRENIFPNMASIHQIRGSLLEEVVLLLLARSGYRAPFSPAGEWSDRGRPND